MHRDPLTPEQRRELEAEVSRWDFGQCCRALLDSAKRQAAISDEDRPAFIAINNAISARRFAIIRAALFNNTTRKET